MMHFDEVLRMTKSHKFGCTVNFNVSKEPSVYEKNSAEMLGVLPRNTKRVIAGSGGVYDGVSLTNKEKIERNISLPDVLNIYDIAQLHCSDERERKIFMDVIYLAFHYGKLEGVQNERPSNCEARFYGVFMNVDIYKSDFKSWFYSNDIALPKESLLLNWWAEDVKEKQVGYADKKRLDSLKLFVAYIWNVKGNNGVPEFPYSFPCEVESIYKALCDWEQSRIKGCNSIKKEWLVISYSTFSDFWKRIDERKEICHGKGRGEKEDRDFFEKIKY